MKILRVSSDLYPAFVGGIALHVHELSVMQSKMGHDVTVYTSIWTNEPLYEDRGDYDVIRFKGFTIFRNSITLKLLSALISNAKNYDVVHAHSQLYCSTLFCVIGKRIKKFPLIITNHGLVSQTVPLWIQKIYMMTIGSFVLKSADYIITYTIDEKKLLVDYGVDPSKIIIIHNGINVEKFLIPLNVDKKKQILWIGKYVPGKGVEYLVEGFADFSHNYPDYSLLMIGRGPGKDMICNKIDQLSLNQKIKMVDFIPNDELQIIYEESMIFISPSLAEGVPKTMLEAMVCGLPVISTDLPQLVDIVEGCGIIIPCRDPSAICHALEQMTTDPQFMAQCGENGRTKVLSNYDWRDTVEKTNELFTKLISS
ncbi:glycosyltransferase family 4 protein [Methanocorpusculum labreanum]|nr:glycosyltransferase family 4 protein [Methanocorpusculum labreanum]